MQKRLQLLIAMLVLVVSVAMAQVTTSGISGKVTSQGEEVIGATVTATHQPSGTVYRAVTNMDGRFSIQGMRPGGPYKPEFGIRLCHKVYGTTRHDISSLHKCEWLSIVCKK